ncbi:MAG: hypothetical protein QOC81_1243 [Thermoanaerobaculia bacterium]|jgi:hypothetical protein|nr:hypothetical protein [Thermoanaerobaculia bacterium]
MKIALFIAAALALPLIALRGRALRRCLGTQTGAALAFAALVPYGRVLHIDVDSYLVLVTFGAIVLSIPLAFLAFADEVRWSANRAFLIAAVGYAVMIPLQLRTPIDGDEPYYLMMTESLVRDHDLDLSNQYRDIAHSDTGRPDLVPQPGDPRGPHGEQYSRHEPFLPILMMPGYALAGLPGALAVIALFGALLARSTVRFFEDEGIADSTTRALFPLIAFGPPIVFYATRIWPEVPAAFCFLEAVRGMRQRRPPRWIAAVFALVLLKIRFGLIAVVLLARALRTRRQLAIAAAVVAVPLAVAWLISGNVMNTHSWRELLPAGAVFYWLGLFGLVLDGAAGLLFQAPLYVLSVIALPRWRTMPEGFRLGISSSLLYILYLVPRSEWHGGWSPPLRYIVVLMPILALGCAALWERIGAGTAAVIAGWTLMLVVHGAAFPWRLFHLATGENFIGESLSERWHSDFSRLMPSFIRPNFAATVGSVAVVVAVILSRRRTVEGPPADEQEGRGSFAALRRLRMTALMTGVVAPLALTALLLAAFTCGRKPADRVELEDAHVIHKGGEVFPPEWTVSRFLYQGGWTVRAGDALSFLAKPGRSTLRYQSPGGATIEIGGHAFVLPPTGAIYGYAAINIGAERTELHCLDGSATLDWMQHD